MDKLGQGTAFPFENVQMKIDGKGTQKGITQRYFTVCMIIQGLINNGTPWNEVDNKAIVEKAYKLTDELLKQENI
jgi:hypothetical protein